MKAFRFDIFCSGRFQGTITLKYPPHWVFTEEEIRRVIESRLPSLIGKKWGLGFA